jgi:hypothetical protein
MGNGRLGLCCVTLSQVLQLYAPLLGLLALAFWTGGLSARVKALENSVKQLVDEAKGENTVLQRLTRLETQMEGAIEASKEVKRGLDGENRQLSALVVQRRGVKGPLADTMGD